MELPGKFKSDISTRIINLFPTVVIDGNIFLSTKNHSKLGQYYKPILLSIPRIKESIDFESRKFKISNVTLKLSNYEINGERFTDLLSDKSYLGTEAIVRWETVGATDDDDRLDIFTGVIKRITHDDKFVNIHLEDDSQTLFQKQIPIARTSKSYSLSSSKRNKPIPMVYGHIKQSPTVVDVNNTLKADSQPVTIVGKRGQTDDWYFPEDNWASSYYEEHPTWGDFLQQQGALNNQGVPALTMVIDGYTVYVPEETTKGLGFDASMIYTRDKTTQWQNSDNEEGQIVLLHKNFKYEVDSSTKDTKSLVQVINPMKSPSVTCHYRHGYGDNMTGISNTTNILNDSGYGWRENNVFKDEVTEKLSDFNYDYLTFSEMGGGGWDPGTTWPWNGDYLSYTFYANRYEPNGTHIEPTERLAQANQTLLRVSIDSEPPFEYYKVYEMVQLAINGFQFPRMSSKSSKLDHSFYITARTRDGDNEYGNTWYGSSGLLRLARYSNAAVFSLGTRIDCLGTNPPFDPDYITVPLYHQEDESHRFRKLFAFPELEGETYDGGHYEGLVPGDEGYENLITCYNLDCDGVNGSPNPTVESWYVQVTQSTHALNQINLSWGAYISKLTNATGMVLFEGSVQNTHWVPDDWHEVIWSMDIGGKWSEIDILQLLDIENPMQKDYYLNVTGRKDANLAIEQENAGDEIYDGLMVNPIDIMRDIAIDELGLSEDMIDEQSYNHAKVHNKDIKFAFSVHELIEGKELLEDMAKSTLCFPYFNSSGKLAFPSLQIRYGYEGGSVTRGYVHAKTIEEKDIIKFSFNKTKAENVYTSINFNYNYSYLTEDYRDTYSSTDGSMTSSELTYHGYNDVDDNVLVFDSRYITDSTVASEFARLLYRYYRNPHLEVKIKLPLNYIEVGVGSLIKFEDLINGIRAYGIDYSKVSRTNVLDVDGNIHGSQWLYPIFFVSSVTKNINSVEIVAQQLHQLWKSWDGELYDSDSWIDAGLYEPPIVEEEVVEEEDVVEEEEVVEEDDDEIVWDYDSDIFTYQLYSTLSSQNPVGGGTYYLFMTYGNLFLGQIESYYLQPANIGNENGMLDSFDGYNDLVPEEEVDYHNYTIIELFLQMRPGGSTVPEIADYAGQIVLRLKNIAEGVGTPPMLRWHYEYEWLGISGLVGDDSWEDIRLYRVNQTGPHYFKYYESDATNSFIYAYNQGLVPNSPVIINSTTLPFLATAEEGHIPWLSDTPPEVDEAPVEEEGPTNDAGYPGGGNGDVNLDQTLNILDLVTYVNWILGITQGDMPNQSQADFNGDSTVNILDIVALVNWILSEQGYEG